MEHARKNNAEPEVINELENFPDRQYANMAEVMKGFGQEQESA
ncbi:MAG: DUF2795 domain-containing protein [Desulfovibrionales bacterium]